MKARKNSRIVTIAIAAFLAAAVVVLLLLSGSNNWINWENFPKDMAKKGLLPKQITDNLPEYQTQAYGNGVETVYSFSKRDSETNEYIHKIQMTVDNATNYLTLYHYDKLDFEYTPEKEPMTIDEGRAMALDFVKAFLPEVSNLGFINIANDYPALYEAGKVESWSALDGYGHKYLVMVDLVNRYVSFFNIFQA